MTSTRLDTDELLYFDKTSRFILRVFRPKHVTAFFIVTILLIPFITEEIYGFPNYGLQRMSSVTGLPRHLWIYGGLVVAIVLIWDQHIRRIFVYHISLMLFLVAFIGLSYRGGDMAIYAIQVWRFIFEIVMLLVLLNFEIAIRNLIDKADYVERIAHRALDASSVPHG